jgi:hypothetical protein
MTKQKKKKTYRINFGDGHVLMDEQRINALFSKLPLLQMAFNNDAIMELKKCPGGSILLDMDPSFNVSRDSFILLTNCLLELEPIPPRNGRRWRDLVQTITTLGGCSKLESRLEDNGASPPTPEEDKDDEFVWSVFETSEYNTLRPSDAEKMRSEGYSYTGFQVDDKGHKIHFYRKKKPEKIVKVQGLPQSFPPGFEPKGFDVKDGQVKLGSAVPIW